MWLLEPGSGQEEITSLHDRWGIFFLSENDSSSRANADKKPYVQRRWKTDP
jgi:hypothetical protein